MKRRPAGSGLSRLGAWAPVRCTVGAMNSFGTLHFERLARSHFPLLQRWLAVPHVARWWAHDTSAEAVEADFGPTVDGTDTAEIFIVREGGQPAGLVQWYTFADNPGYIDELAVVMPVPAAALSMDYFVGEASALRRGLGAAMLRASLERIWRAYPLAPSVIVPVNAANVASWRVLERAGLHRVAQGRLQPDNPIDDWEHHVYRIDRPAG